MALGRKPIEIVRSGKHKLLVKADHWERIYLHEVATVQNGFAFISSDFSKEEGLPLIRIRDIDNNFTVDRFKGKYHPDYLVNNGDILIGMDGDFRAAKWNGGKGLLNQRVCRILPKSIDFDPAFLFICLQPFLDAIHSETSSVTVKHISSRTIEEIPLPFPPLKEQRKIVSKIEELFSELDKGIEQLKTAQQQLKVYRQAVLKYAFEGRFTRGHVPNNSSPEDWRVVLLSEICRIIGGVTKGKDFKGKPTIQLPYLRVANVQDGYLDLSVIKTIEVLPSDKEKYRLEYGDILYTEGGDKDKLGRGTIWKNEIPECIHQNHIFRARPFSDGYDSKYISYFSQTKSAKAYFFKHGKQTTNLASINLTILSNLPIPICSITEQKQVVQEIESRLSVCDKLEETISNSLKQAEALRQSILKKAFEGKLLSENELQEIHKIAIPQPEVSELPIAAEPKVAYKRKVNQPQIQFPKVIEGITTTDLHAGILAIIIEAHASSKHQPKLSHVKGEKIAHLVEAHIGIDLGRVPKKDAAGPDDYPHLKKVESRANKANWFGVKKLKIGHTYVAKSGVSRIIGKVKEILSSEDMQKIESLIHTFLPFELEHAEVIATVYAAWNNLLLEGKKPTDEEIVYESRENWSERKLRIERENFFKVLKWMRKNGYVPKGLGKKVLSR